MAAEEQQRQLGERSAASGSVSGGPARLRADVLGIPPPELVNSADYARYEALLPLMLAGAVLPGSSDYTWFMGVLTEWPFCAAEYAELQQLFSDPPAAVGLVATNDLAFLRRADPAHAEPALGSSSLAGLRPRLEPSSAGPRRLQVRFIAASSAHLAQVAEPVAKWEATPQPMTANPSAEADATARLLFTVGPDDATLAAYGLRYLTIAVQPDRAGMCRVQLGLEGMPLTLPAAPQITLALPSGDRLSLTLDAQSQAYSPPLALTALAAAVITIEWPLVS